MKVERGDLLQNDETFKESFDAVYDRARKRLFANKDFKETLAGTFLANDGELDTTNEPIIFGGQISVFSLIMKKTLLTREIIISTVNEPENEIVTLFESDSGYRLISYVKIDKDKKIIDSQENNAAAISRINQFLRGIPLP